MSVAFRRDCDEEHLEPKFELPLPPGPNIVTQRGFDLIEARNAALDVAIAEAPTGEARDPLLRDRRYWRSRLASAQIAPVPSGEAVAIGTSVTIEQAGRRRVLEIVGHDESEPDAGRIAFAAPLARALLGCEVGEEVDSCGPAGAAKIIAIDVRAR